MRFVPTRASERTLPVSATFRKDDQMEEPDTVIAVFADHSSAEAAVRKLASADFDMKKLSILGKGYHADENVVGFCTAGDRIKFWGVRGAFWGGLWGLFFGGLFMTIPVVGHVIVPGSLAAIAISALESAIMVGGLSALGAALYSIGAPKDSHKVGQALRTVATGGFALVALFGVPASAEDALNTAGANPDRGTFLMVLDDRGVQPILGKEVRGSNGEDMARIVNLIVDRAGRPRAAIVDFGGFLGVGSRKIVVDWNALRFDSDNGPISLALTPDQVKAAPEYRDGKPVEMLGIISQSVVPEM